MNKKCGPGSVSAIAAIVAMAGLGVWPWTTATAGQEEANGSSIGQRVQSLEHNQQHIERENARLRRKIQALEAQLEARQAEHKETTGKQPHASQRKTRVFNLKIESDNGELDHNME
jgi:predicted RNase H-like nuclease (RuvC/YqgF family)